MIRAKVIEAGEVVDRVFVSELPPYIYIRKLDRKKAEQVIKKHVPTCEIVDDGSISILEDLPMLKVNLFNPKSVPPIRKELHLMQIPTYESDVPYIRRWMIDSDIRFTDKRNALSFDIEVDASKGFPLPAVAEAQIVSIAAMDNQGGEFFFYAKTGSQEKKLLYDFYALCQKYTVIGGWNSQAFDLAYLDKRSERLDVELEWKKLNHLDIMLCIKKVRRTGERSYTLQYFAEKYLGESKSFHEHSWYDNRSKMMEILSDYDMLKEYNLKDVDLVQKIDNEFEMSMIYSELARLQYVFPSDTRFRGVGTDAFLLRLSMISQPRVVWPNRGHSKTPDEVIEQRKRKKKSRRSRLPDAKKKKEEREKRVKYPDLRQKPSILADGEEWPELEGGLVLPTTVGRHEWVMLFDYSNLYGSIISTFNMGVRTKTDQRTEHGFLLFDQDKESLFATAIRQLEERRTHYKRLEKKYPKDSLEYQHYRTIERALKVAMLANWGVIADDDSRFFVYDVAASITGAGRYLLRLIVSIAEEVGLKVLYGDTDGLFLLWGDRDDYNAEKLLELGKKFEKYANKRIREIMFAEFNLREETFSINLELGTIYRSFRLPAHGQKKRYMGLKVWEDDFKYEKDFIGLEAVRSDAPILIQEIQETLYRMDLEENKPVDEIRGYLTELCREVFDGKLDEKLIKSKAMSKNIDEYKTSLPHVRAAAQHPGVQPGDKIHFVVLSNKSGKQKVAVVIGSKIPEIGEDGYIYIWDDLIVPMLERTFGTEFVVTSDGALNESLEAYM